MTQLDICFSEGQVRKRNTSFLERLEDKQKGVNVVRNPKRKRETGNFFLRFDVPELTWTAPCLHFVYVSYIDHAGYAGRDTGNREASSGDRSPGVPLLGIQNP